MTAINDGGPAFPESATVSMQGDVYYSRQSGLTVRDYFAAHVQADDRLVKCVRAMDDTALLLFARDPGCEREEWITETGNLCGAAVFDGKSEVEKILLRLTLEAKAIARVRFLQADAMMAEGYSTTPSEANR